MSSGQEASKPLIANYTPALRRRLAFLLVGNLLVLLFIGISTMQTEGASFRDELARAGRELAPTVLAGMALTAIIFTGAIDISIGAVMVMAGTVFGILSVHDFGPPVCFLACLLTALVLVSLNGLLIELLRVPAIIFTLAGLTFYRGLALLSGRWTIDNFSGQIAILDEAYKSPGKHYGGWILLIAVVLVAFWEWFGRLPRLWLARGSSAAACELHGLRPSRITQSAFVAGGALLSLAALTDVTNRLTIEPARMLIGFELRAIGGVVLGGTNIFGGEGSFLGTVLGVTFLYWVEQGLIYADISEYWRTAIHGAVLLTIIGLDCALHRRQHRLEELR